MKRILLILLISFALLVSFSVAGAGTVSFEWDANSESDLAGYRLYQSQVAGGYTFDAANVVVEVPAGTEECSITLQKDGKFFWVVTAFDTAGNESGPSNEVTADLNFQPPAAPTGCLRRMP